MIFHWSDQYQYHTFIQSPQSTCALELVPLTITSWWGRCGLWSNSCCNKNDALLLSSAFTSLLGRYPAFRNYMKLPTVQATKNHPSTQHRPNYSRDWLVLSAWSARKEERSASTAGQSRSSPMRIPPGRSKLKASVISSFVSPFRWAESRYRKSWAGCHSSGLMMLMGKRWKFCILKCLIMINHG